MKGIKILSLVIMLALFIGIGYGVYTLFIDISDGIDKVFSDETTSTGTSSDISSGEVTSSTVASTVAPSASIEWNDPDREYYMDQSDMGLGYIREPDTNNYLFAYLMSFDVSEGYKSCTLEWIIDPAFLYEVDAYFHVRFVNGKSSYCFYFDDYYNPAGGTDIRYKTYETEEEMLHGVIKFTSKPSEDYDGLITMIGPLMFEADSIEECQAVCKILEKYVHVRLYME